MRPGIAEIHEKLIRREVSAVELAKAFLSRIERLDGELNAYITVTADAAVAAAEAVDRRIAAGERVPALAGVPMTYKDVISTKGVLTTCASKMLSDYVPVFDAFVVERLNGEGAVSLGKTNCDEFAMGSSCETSWFGPTKNPYDPSRVPGGSSGGGAAAVAAGMAVYAIGSDTGGSVRQPCAFCGLVGLKPTYGAVSRWGLVAYASSLDQIGVMANSAEDAAVVFDAISAYDGKDATCDARERVPAAPSIGGGVSGMRIGVLTDMFEGLNPAVRAALDKALAVFESLGARVEPVKIDRIDMVLPTYYILACAEAASNLARYDGVRYGYRTEKFADADEMISKTRSEGFGAEVQRRIMLGNYVLSSGYFDAYYKKAQQMRDIISRGAAAAFEGASGADMLFCPTTTSTAFRAGSISDPVEMYLSDLCTVTANLCGLPALSAPCGFDGDGAPIGLQLIGAKFTEDKLLRAASAFAAAGGSVERTPMIGGAAIEF